MTRRLAIALAAFGCLAAGPVGSAAPEQLIRQLGDREFRSREAAARELEKCGESALPAMRVALANADPEVKQRLALLIGRLERSSLLSPKLVSLHAEQKPAGQVFDEISKQTGYKLVVQQGNTQ